MERERKMERERRGWSGKEKEGGEWWGRKRKRKKQGVGGRDNCVVCGVCMCCVRVACVACVSVCVCVCVSVCVCECVVAHMCADLREWGLSFWSLVRASVRVLLWLIAG